MTIYQALKKNRPLRRRDHTFAIRPPNDQFFAGSSSYTGPEAWIHPIFLVSSIVLTIEDLTAIDWEVRNSG